MAFYITALYSADEAKQIARKAKSLDFQVSVQGGNKNVVKIGGFAGGTLPAELAATKELKKFAEQFRVQYGDPAPYAKDSESWRTPTGTPTKKATDINWHPQRKYPTPILPKSTGAGAVRNDLLLKKKTADSATRQRLHRALDRAMDGSPGARFAGALPSSAIKTMPDEQLQATLKVYEKKAAKLRSASDPGWAHVTRVLNELDDEIERRWIGPWTRATKKAKDLITKPRDPNRKPMCILDPKDLEKMTGVPGARLTAQGKLQARDAAWTKKDPGQYDHSSGAKVVSIGNNKWAGYKANGIQHGGMTLEEAKKFAEAGDASLTPQGRLTARDSRRAKLHRALDRVMDARGKDLQGQSTVPVSNRTSAVKVQQRIDTKKAKKFAEAGDIRPVGDEGMTSAQHLERAAWYETQAVKEKTGNGYSARGTADLRLAATHRKLAKG